MKLKPTGYYVLVKMEEVKQEVQEGALKGFIMHSNEDQERQQNGHDVGVVVAFGPAAFSGFEGVPMHHPNGTAYSVEQRAELWGVKVGDKVEMNRYDGKKPRHADYHDHRLIQDAHIIGVFKD